MDSAQPERSSIGKEIAVLGLAALSFFGGCGTNNQRDDFLDARASATAKVDFDEELLSLKGFSERKPVSLGDVSSNFVTLDPRRSYLIEVPYGTYKEISGSIVNTKAGWNNTYRTDDVYVFTVPNNPSQYAVKLERQDWCDEGGWDEYDGTYLFLINMAEGSTTASAIKFPVNARFFSETKNHGNLIMIRSEEDGKIFEVPTPRQLGSDDRHHLPNYIRAAHNRIYQRQKSEKL
jgi:hypothetical protein